MKKYLKWSITTTAITLFLGLTFFLISKFFFSDTVAAVVKDNPTPEQQLVIDTQWDAADVISDDALSTKEKLFTMIHEMANTKIIAKDGLIWGLQPITKQRVERVKKAVIDLKVDDPKINEILERWSKQDFSQAVEDHNYVWAEYLDGNIGKAKALRK